MQLMSVLIPRYRHGEFRCREAKEELSRFDEFDVYEEVKENGDFWFPQEKRRGEKGKVQRKYPKNYGFWE